jgi:hydrogenase maturation protein HypF
MNQKSAVHIHITGIVQGVGFRPFVYGLAQRLGLTGWVRNTSAGVDILVEGAAETLQRFAADLRGQAPPLSQIESFQMEAAAANGCQSFEILESEPIPAAFMPISADVATCPDCLRELLEPADRHYRYPFINCTNCGPRFTIITDIPYDRPNTTMAGFPLCPECAQEYHDPRDRRFHAQPVACPQCGPHIWLEYPVGQAVSLPRPPEDNTGQADSLSYTGDEALLQAQKLLASGAVVAIKGLGGFHLACDASNPQAVERLRQRKLRVDKPFALMMPNLAAVQEHCLVNDREAELLESRQRPVVLLQRRPESSIAAQVAPQQHTLGVMLPYTPLHHLLFAAHPLAPGFTPPQALVMTSGNLSEEPIATGNEEARDRLGGLADAYLMHNRPIRTRCDDSVERVDLPSAPSMLRRSRGYAPSPLYLPWESPPLLAAGAELKNTFCLAREKRLFLSHHIGDLENYETLQAFEDGIAHMQRLFRVSPTAIAYDLHPDYLATRYALERAERERLPALGVQHHHAHIAACMADNGLDGSQPVLGLAFDGTGYGEDGAMWGGEFLLADYAGFQRLAHLRYAPLPGGDAAIRRPARTALAFLWQCGLDWEPELPPCQELCADDRTLLRSQLEHGINSPPTSSLGRLFDAAAALVGVRQKVNYEAQAAIELEALSDPHETSAYTFELSGSHPIIIDYTQCLHELAQDVLHGVPQPAIAARFHNGLAHMALAVCLRLRRETGVKTVALSGGVWQNRLLLRRVAAAIQAQDFTLYTHQQVPANDGGIALGQAAVAAWRLNHS